MVNSVQGIFYLIIGFLAAIGLLVTMKVFFKALKRLLSNEEEEKK